MSTALRGQNLKVYANSAQKTDRSAMGNYEECLPIQRKRKYDMRAIVDAILWYLRAGRWAMA